MLQFNCIFQQNSFENTLFLYIFFLQRIKIVRTLPIIISLNKNFIETLCFMNHAAHSRVIDLQYIYHSLVKIKENLWKEKKNLIGWECRNANLTYCIITVISLQCIIIETDSFLENFVPSKNNFTYNNNITLYHQLTDRLNATSL